MAAAPSLQGTSRLRRATVLKLQGTDVRIMDLGYKNQPAEVSTSTALPRRNAQELATHAASCRDDTDQEDSVQSLQVTDYRYCFVRDWRARR
jgi:hypothetical protein